MHTRRYKPPEPERYCASCKIPLLGAKDIGYSIVTPDTKTPRINGGAQPMCVLALCHFCAAKQLEVG